MIIKISELIVIQVEGRPYNQWGRHLGHVIVFTPKGYHILTCKGPVVSWMKEYCYNRIQGCGGSLQADVFPTTHQAPVGYTAPIP